MAAAAGKSPRWLADQLEHADPGFTLRTYAHVFPNQETDLSFADFGGPRRFDAGSTLACQSSAFPHPAFATGST
jgi:hypothetical protein